MEEYVWILIGSLFIIVGFFFNYVTYSIRKNGIKTSAEVKNHSFTNEGSESLIQEVYTFKDKSGREYNASSIINASFGMHSVGDTVEIIYDEENPEKVLPNNPLLLYLHLLPITFGLICILLYFLGIKIN